MWSGIWKLPAAYRRILVKMPNCSKPIPRFLCHYFWCHRSSIDKLRNFGREIKKNWLHPKIGSRPIFPLKKKSFQKIFIPIILGIHFWDINHKGRMAIRYSLITIFFSLLQVFVIINNIVLLQHVWRSLMFVNWLFVQIRFNDVLDDNYCRNDKISLTFAFLYSKLVSHCFRKLLNSSEFVKEKLKIDSRTWL